MQKTYVDLVILVVLAGFLITITITNSGVNDAYACSCSGERPVSEYIEKSSSTFVGTVQSAEPNSKAGGYDIRFVNVSRVWGVWVNDYPDDGQVTVRTSSLGAGDCGYPFEEGEEYLVYTQRDESNNILKVDLCNGTKPANQAESDFRILGSGTNPLIVMSGNSIPATHSGRLFTVADFILPALYAGGAAAAAWMFVRYRRKGQGGQLGPIFAGIAFGLAFVMVFSLVYGGYINLEQLSEDADAGQDEEHLVCSSVSGFWPYHKAGIAESIEKDSDLMIVIGTITNVETRALEFYASDSVFDPTTSTSKVVGYTPTGRKIPYKVVDLEVERYLIDQTGRGLQNITFRAPANACVDDRNGEIVSLPASFDSDPASDPDNSPRFNIGDRSLIEIHRWHDGEYNEEGLDAESRIKLDIDENGYVKDPRTGIATPIKIADLENEITAEIERLSR